MITTCGRWTIRTAHRSRLLVLWCGAIGISVCAAGCSKHPAPSPAIVSGSPPVIASGTAPIPTNEPLPLDTDAAKQVQRIIESQQKRVMGRRSSKDEIERVVNEIAPLIEKATHQPIVETALQKLATRENISVEAAREEWAHLQEGDIVLESGGERESVSSANAVGVAQWLASTARRNGLQVDSEASKRLTRKIEALDAQITFLKYRMGETKTGADLREQMVQLEAKRKALDTRYDPEKAIAAQTLYLARLYNRYGSLDWVYQAYHGGEAGVRRLLEKYGTSPSDSPVSPTFETIYREVAPNRHAAAFDYLYGRGDDHRHYWWKIRAAAQAIALYRRDKAAFTRLWESLQPGHYLEMAWYPNDPQTPLATPAIYKNALRQTRILPLTTPADFSFIVPLPPLGTRDTAALRPAAKGLLLLLASAWRRLDGSSPLALGDTALTQTELASSAPVTALPTTKDVLPGFNFHTTGIALDLIPPRETQKRRRLEYLLSYLEDRRILWRVEKTERKRRVMHVVPNPHYGDALAAIAESGKVPELPGL